MDWLATRVGDVAQVNPRRPRIDISSETPVAFLPMAAISDQLLGVVEIQSRPFQEVSNGYTYFEEGDVLFAKITPCLQNGKHTLLSDLTQGFGFGSTEFHVIRAGNNLDPRHLFRVLTQPSSIKECVASFTGTAGQQRVQPEVLRSLPIFLPPLPEQRAIAAVLDSIDGAIEHTDAVIAATERLRDALLHELLTRGVPGWHSSWKDVPGLGTVPASWEVVRLGDRIEEGPTNGIYKPESEYGGGICLIRIDDFVPGALVNTGSFQRIRASEDERRRYAVREGDILINRVNSLSHIGKTVLIRELGEPTLFESNMMKLRMDSGVLPRFAEMALLSHAARGHFVARAKKAVQQASINQQDVVSFPLSLPPLSEQGAITGMLDAVDATIERARGERSGLLALKASASDALLTGRVRVGV